MIIGMTDQGPQFPQLGILRKGAPKAGNKPGEDLKHFRFDTPNEEAAALFAELYGKEPRAIRVFLPFATAAENFEAWREEWAASSLKHRCDGQTCVRHQTKQGDYSNDPIPCPGGCKQVGRLQVVIPELKILAFVTVLTTSIHDIINLHKNLLALEHATRGNLRGVPLVLRRVPRKISTPSNDGRARREKWLLTIEPAAEWTALLFAAQEREALPQADARLLTTSLTDEDFEADDDTEVVTPEMITDAQLTRLNQIIDGLQTLGVTQEQWRVEMKKLVGVDEIAELTNDNAAKVVQSFDKRLAAKKQQATAKVAA